MVKDIYDSRQVVREMQRIAAHYRHRIPYGYLIENAAEFFASVEEPAASRTMWQGRPSENSLSFGEPVENDRNRAFETVSRVFDIPSESGFREKFKDAAGGSAQEWRRITVMTSSALVALLCFWDVSEKSPLEIELGDVSLVMAEASFEVENKIPKSNRPSNIDIVLKGCYKDSDKKAHILLESKFSEYLSGGKCQGISRRVYGDIYAALSSTFKGMGLKTKPEGGDRFCLTTETGVCHRYTKGVKQMISHFMGAETYAGENSGVDVFLAEILFDFGEKSENRFYDYCGLHRKLAEGLNSLGKPVTVVGECLTYQGVFRNRKMNNRVKLFYQL